MEKKPIKYRILVKFIVELSTYTMIKLSMLGKTLIFAPKKKEPHMTPGKFRNESLLF